MKNYSIIFALCTVTLSTACLMAKPGCMDTSWQLTQRFDNKEEHFVSCNCPCDEYPQTITKQNACMKCNHQHRAPRMEFIKTSEKGNAQAARLLSLYNPSKITTAK